MRPRHSGRIRWLLFCLLTTAAPCEFCGALTKCRANGQAQKRNQARKRRLRVLWLELWPMPRARGRNRRGLFCSHENKIADWYQKTTTIYRQSLNSSYNLLNQSDPLAVFATSKPTRSYSSSNGIALVKHGWENASSPGTVTCLCSRNCRVASRFGERDTHQITNAAFPKVLSASVGSCLSGASRRQPKPQHRDAKA